MVTELLDARHRKRNLSSLIAQRKKRKNMNSPRIGVVRDSMLVNPRLIKAPLGQSKSRGLLVPGPDFTYGTSSGAFRDGGVAEVLSGWRVQTDRGDSDPHPSLTPDFVSLNRDAVKSGLVTSKELSQYRAQRAEAASQAFDPRPRDGVTPRRPAVPDITFGVTNRTPSPLADILSHQFGRHWVEKQLSRSQSCSHQQRMDRIKTSYSKDNRASLLRRSQPLPVTEAPPTTPRFTQVAPALNTFRDQETRLRAFRAHHSDSVSRRGAQGLGTYSLD